MNELIIRSERSSPIISRHLYGHFVEHLGTGVYEGTWVGENSPIPNTRGIRNDVVAALRKIAVPNIRWPGGCYAETYHWRDGIGPSARRPETYNCWSCGTVESNHFGTHEFMDLCEQIGAEPYICGNLGGGTVQEMAEWLSYLTTPASSPLSKERRANGRKDPWPMKWWAVGNENWGCGGHMSAEHYAWEFRRYGTFCRSHSGGKLYKVACGYEDDWNEVVMREARDYMDGLSIHHYSRLGVWGKDGDPTDFTFDPEGKDVGFAEKHWRKTMSMASDLDAFIQRTLAIMDRHDPAHRIGLIVDEWGTWHLEPPDKPVGAVLYQQNTIRDAIAAGLMLNILHKHAGRVHMANIAQMVNVLQSMVMTSDSKMILTPTYHVFEMNRVHHDATFLPAEFQGGSVSTLSASASQDKFGKIHLSLVNAHPSDAALVGCKLSETSPNKVSARILTAPAIDSHNTFDHPEVVTPHAFRNYRFGNGQIDVESPPRSLLVL